MEMVNLLILSSVILIFPFFWPLFFGVSKEVEPEKTSRILFFDYLKGIAIIAVIIIHSFGFITISFKNNETGINLINNILRFAVPFFFILSGILLNPNIKGKLKNFYNRKIIRLVIPYTLCVSAISSYDGNNIIEFFKLLITGGATVPYYFFIILFQFYLLYPFLVKIKDKKWFLLSAFFVSLMCFLIPQTWEIFGIIFFGKYLFFFAYGINRRNYFLSNTFNKKESTQWLFLIFISIILPIINPAKYFNVRLVYGVALFNVFFILKDKINLKKYLNLLIIKFGQNSLWIFLTHYLVVKILSESLPTGNFWIYSSSLIVFSLILSYWLAKLLNYLYQTGINKLQKNSH